MTEVSDKKVARDIWLDRSDLHLLEILAASKRTSVEEVIVELVHDALQQMRTAEQ